MTTHISITLSVTTTSEAEAAQIAEQLARQAVGFGLSGQQANISISTFDYVEEEIGP